MIHLMPLPYDKTALEPIISKETLTYHHERHHKGYVDMLNTLVANTSYQDLSLMDMIKKSHKDAASVKIFNNAAQVWNHDFYWHGFTASQETFDSHSSFGQALIQKFQTLESFLDSWVAAGIGQFASGWAWLMKTPDRTLEIKTTSNAMPLWLEDGLVPLLVWDVWEHAYYIDYRNDRKSHLTALKTIVNWGFAQENWDRSEVWSRS